MRKLILAGLAGLAIVSQSAFARNLGALGESERPNNLVAATEYANDQELRSDARRGSYHHGGYYHHRHHYYNPYYYPYYPYYYYPYYYGSSYHLDGNAAAEVDSNRVPVVCFASDSAGNWYAHDANSSSAVSAQEAANHECSGANANCNLNLGCAIATSEQPVDQTH